MEPNKIQLGEQEGKQEREVFSWYEEIEMSTPLSQGDIIDDFPVPEILDTDQYPFFRARAAEYHVIVMTQACDLEQGKVDHISLCAIEPLEEIVKTIMLDEAKKTELSKGVEEDKIQLEELINFAELNSAKKKQVKKVIQALRQGQQLNFHLLNKNETGNNGTTINLDFNVVLLKQTFQVPIKTAEKIIADKALTTSKRLRLLPPYREHLAQAYAVTYSRIGLPIDIVVNSAYDKVLSSFNR